MADPSAPPEDDPELDEHDPRVDADPMMAARATIVGLEAIADLFASFALQANRLAGVLEASIGAAGDTIVDWPTLEEFRAAQAEREAAELDRTEVIRVSDPISETVALRVNYPAGGELRFPRP